MQIHIFAFNRIRTRPEHAFRDVCGSRDSSVDIVNGLQTSSWEIVVCFRAGTRDKSFQAGCGAHQTSCSVGTTCKATGAENERAKPLPPPLTCLRGVGCYCGKSGWVVLVTTCPLLAPRIRMSGAIPPVHCMACTGTDLPLTYLSVNAKWYWLTYILHAETDFDADALLIL